jgi:hypothetical protein
MNSTLTVDDLVQHYKTMYFVYMTNYPNATFEEFKRIQIEFSSIILDKIDDKYADHAEGISRECIH